MFGLLQPNKEQVGGRLKQIKEEMNISFSEFGNRLGLKKPTINSYVQGYNLAPLEVIEKVSKISGRSIGWFYFGEVEEYIENYLSLKGQSKLVSDYPEVAVTIKNEFYSGDFKNSSWENEFGYPAEEFIDDCFGEVHADIMNDYISDIVIDQINQSEKLKNLTDKEKEDTTAIVIADVVSYSEMSGDINYGDKEAVVRSIDSSLNNIDKRGKIEFSEEYVIGKLINMLNDDQETESMISELSLRMTGKMFSTQYGGNELVEIFQLMRPALMKLYSEKTRDEIYEWFEK
ncbi:helix-turn-helix domain-containing protein [Enterococcus faecalis]|uniref:helix-turn-helix domain-containing protein n=1 Tax=Enterococcus faecalis TaxID=1351 RepID=UPI00209125A4|nr:helix-turn-helix transcriptional regulator [Enterococcus faecalis]MCO5447801.1 helix-turn-helix domain-containing protein [Enterococcus faecalis]